MANIYQPVNGVPGAGVAYPDAAGTYWNTAMQSPFANILMYAARPSGIVPSGGGIVLGGIQSFDPVEDAPSRKVYQSGSFWKEYVMQPRDLNVACTRVFPTGYDIRSCLKQIYGNVGDMYFPQLPVYLALQYLQMDPSGNRTVASSVWTWAEGVFERVRGPYWSDAYSELREDWTWNGRGIAMTNITPTTGNGDWGTNPAYNGFAPATGP